MMLLAAAQTAFILTAGLIGVHVIVNTIRAAWSRIKEVMRGAV